MASSEKWIFLGKILREWGIRGQVRMIPYNLESDLFSRLEKIYLEGDASFRELKVLSAKRHGRFWLLHFEGYENPEMAKELRLAQIAVPRSDMPKPEQGELYLCDLEGASVESAEGRALGVILRFITVGESEVMVIQGPQGKEAMVPYRGEFVQSTSLEEKRIVLKESAEDLL